MHFLFYYFRMTLNRTPVFKFVKTVYNVEDENELNVQQAPREMKKKKKNNCLLTHNLRLCTVFN